MSKHASRSQFKCKKSGTEVLFWKSLQPCRLDENMKILDDAILRINRLDLLNHLKGSKAILELLLSVPPSPIGIPKRTSCLRLDQAYEIYLSYEAVSNPEELLHNSGHKRLFKEFICNKDYGLCVYIFKDYIILI